MFWTRRLEQLRGDRSRPCVLAEHGESRTGQVMLLGKCELRSEALVNPELGLHFGVPIKNKDDKNVGDRRRRSSS